MRHRTLLGRRLDSGMRLERFVQIRDQRLYEQYSLGQRMVLAIGPKKRLAGVELSMTSRSSPQF